MQDQLVICITGMHRSGTSLTASWLERCGLKIHDGSVWGSGPGNPKGHFEDKDFVALHNSAIKSENSASKGWILFPQKSMYFKSADHLSQASKLVEIRSAKYKIWGWKDPRTSLYLENWKKILPSLKVIMLWRPCAEVLHSLIRRSKQTKIPLMKIGLIKSLRLWETYNMLLIEYKKKYPQDTLLFSLESIVNSDRKTLNRINSEFQTELNYTPIETIFERKLLTHDRISNYYRILSRCFGCQSLEKKLEDFSEQLEATRCKV
jgi:hypothetical protein